MIRELVEAKMELHLIWCVGPDPPHGFRVHAPKHASLPIPPRSGMSVCAGPLRSVGVGDLADKFGPAHVHGPVDLASLRSRIVLQNLRVGGEVSPVGITKSGEPRS